MFVPVCNSPYIKTCNSKPLSHVELTKVIERHLGYHYSVSQDNPQMFVYGQEIAVMSLRILGHMSDPVFGVWIQPYSIHKNWGGKWGGFHSADINREGAMNAYNRYKRCLY